MNAGIIKREVLHFHIFCGLGGGAKGFNKGQARVGKYEATFRCIGGVDRDTAGLKDFQRLAGVPGTLLDLFNREQYTAFHGHEPPPGWREATPDDMRAAAGYERPHIGFLSAPCKGFSGLLPEKMARTNKYQALNGLTLRGLWLFLETYKDDPVELIVFENVPRIATRGRHLLDQIVAVLRYYGYAVAETTHDCGELGALAQSRKRFLLVARHEKKVPAFLYEPIKHPLAGVGTVLERLPMPGPWMTTAGPMHRMPSLHWKTWLRLAFVKAGSDWRSLNDLAVEDGILRDYGIVPETEFFNGAYGVKTFQESVGVVTSKNQPSSGASSVADPRIEQWGAGQSGVMDWQNDSASTIRGARSPLQGNFSVADPRVKTSALFESMQLGVRTWQNHFGTVTGQTAPGGGHNSVADPRIKGGEKRATSLGVGEWEKSRGVVGGESWPTNGAYSIADPRITDRTPFNHAYRIVEWAKRAPAVTAARGALAAVADPRAPNPDTPHGKYRVTTMDEAAGVIIAASTTGNGAFAVADPRAKFAGDARAAYQTGGHYGVLPWVKYSNAVSGSASHDNGVNSVADPRLDDAGATFASTPLPKIDDRLICIIRARDGTWHRPLTTLELAALQGLVDPEEHLELDGLSDSAWRERIGNAVPPPSATAIASVMGQALLMSWSGQTFTLSNQPIWVQPIAVALSVQGTTA